MSRKVDELGRIVLPVELRRLHGIRPGDALDISVDGDSIVLRKIERGCVFCSGEADLVAYRGRSVCAPCLREISAPAPTG